VGRSAGSFSTVTTLVGCPVRSGEGGVRVDMGMACSPCGPMEEMKGEDKIKVERLPFKVLYIRSGSPSLTHMARSRSAFFATL
jgi:hypothetical protein